MMLIFRKKDGAVTVFLTIILVPIIVISCLFVDASRIRLAQSVVSSAGDLTLNTVLTQYDPILNDYYGMLASCQDIDEFLATADEYFMACVTSQGVEHSDARKYVDQISGMINGNGGEIVDLLQIGEADGGEFTVAPVANGTLANPALVKKEIVEFMKYRAPIDAVAELLDRMRNAAKDLEGTKDDADLTEKKKDYYEAEGEVCKKAYEVYKELKKYNNLGIDENAVNTMKQTLQDAENQYRQCHEKMVKDLFNTEGMGKFQEGYIDVNYQATASEVRKDQVDIYIDTTSQYISEFLTRANSLDGLYRQLPTYNSGTVYDIQFWREWDRNLRSNRSTYDQYVSSANKLIKRMARLTKIMGEEGATWELSEEEKNEVYALTWRSGVDSDGTKSRKEHYKSLKDQYDKLCKEYLKNSNSAYQQITNLMNRFSNNYIGSIDSGETNAKIQSIHSTFNEYYSKFDNAIKYLDNAIKKTEELKNLVNKYQSSFEQWNSAATNYSTDLAKEDRGAIAELDEEVKKNVTKEAVGELLERLKNMKSLMESLKAMVDGYKYNGTRVRDIDSYQKFKSKSGVDASRITYDKNALDSYAKNSFKFSGPENMGNIQITNSNNPSLDVNSPKLYKWMVNRFKDADDGKINEQENKKKDEEKKYKDKVEQKDVGKGNPNSNNEITGDNLPSAQYGKDLSEGIITTDVSKISDKVADLFSNFGANVGQSAVALRDDLYALDYITRMFSYDTYEYEGKYNLCMKKKQTVTLDNYTGMYAAVSKEWVSKELKDTYNKSLTNKLIDTANNFSYGNEVEYILYGKSNKENKQSAYGTIFAIRYALDLFPVFQRYWNANNGYTDSKLLEGIAAGVQTASYGIIPKPLFKLVVILGLTAMEAAKDIQYLKCGMPIELTKSKDDLECTFSEDGVNETTKNKSKSASAMFYSDYLKILLFLKLMGSEEYNVYARVADVIQVNMNNVTGNSFAMNKSVVYFQGTATLEVAPLMLDLPIATNYGVDAPEGGGWNQIPYKSIRGY